MPGSTVKGMAELATDIARGVEGAIPRADPAATTGSFRPSVADVRPTLESREAHDFSIENYRRIHRDLHPGRKDSGQFRKAPSISSDTSRLAEVSASAMEGHAIFDRLEKRGHFHGLARAEFVDRLFDHARKLHAWRPFEYGNVEVLKEHLQRVGQQAGYSVDLSRIDNHRFEEALYSANAHGRHSELYGILFDQAVPTRALEFTKAIKTGEWESAVAKHPELRHARDLVDRASAQLRSGAGPGQDIDPQERAGSRSPRWNQYHTALRRITSEVYSGRLTTAPEMRIRARLLNRAPTP
jgi:fido (protein-threonine AMPylation protein)